MHVPGNTVALGSDYFTTQPGTQFNFGGPIGNVTFMGVPIIPGENVDTIVQRQADASINGAAIPIQLMALSLESTAPVNIGGSFFDVFVTLDAAHLADDRGSMTVHGALAGGTFDSNVNVFFQAHFLPLGGPSIPDFFGSLALSQTGASWAPTPLPGTFLVPGVDDGSAGDQDANLHRGLTCSVDLGCEVDFFVRGALTQRDPNGNTDSVGTATTFTPEPGTAALAAPLLALLLGVKRRRRA